MTDVKVVKRVRFAGSAMELGLYEAYIVEAVCNGKLYTSSRMSLHKARTLKKQIIDEQDVRWFLRRD